MPLTSIPMKRFVFYPHLFFAILLTGLFPIANACSMYKVTVGTTTLVGCNEDAWRLTPRIWFEQGKGPHQYGAGFTGSRWDGGNGFAPQSGMNDQGLSFSRLASHTPKNEGYNGQNKKPITNPTLYLKDILHTCKTVEEVKIYMEQYDHSFFMEDVFIYIDRTGNYLVVEPYTLTLGTQPHYVLSNFCPSVTTQEQARKLNRYRHGADFLEHTTDTTLEFCTALLDTMHVCRSKRGDGTLLSSLWDLNGGNIHIYFYHDYTHRVSFNLQQELAKGDHILNIPDLFPPNAEFKKLANYYIPQNSISIRIFLLLSAGLFLLSSAFFGFSFIKNRKRLRYKYLHLIIVPLGILGFYEMFMLNTTMAVFYFSAPYVDRYSMVTTLFSYFPFVLLGLMVPLFVGLVQVIRNRAWKIFPTGLLLLNNLVYLVLLGLFVYWGLWGF
jgi:hypothetical protein